MVGTTAAEGMTQLLISGFFVTLISTIVVIALSVFLSHRKHMALIEEGAYDELHNPMFDEITEETWSPRHTLAVGLLLAAIGGMRTLELLFEGAASFQGSLILLGLGLALLAYYHVNDSDAD